MLARLEVGEREALGFPPLVRPGRGGTGSESQIGHRDLLRVPVVAEDDLSVVAPCRWACVAFAV